MKQAQSMGRRRSVSSTRGESSASSSTPAHARRNGTTAVGALIGVAFAVLACTQAAAQQVSTTSGTNAPSRSAVVRHVTIKWAKVGGAIGYRILVRPLGGDVTIDERSTSTSIEVVLRPGTYQVRVISFNIFDKPASVSQWHNIDVIHVYKPTVTGLSPKVLYSGLKDVHETVDGHHYLPETVAALTHDGRIVTKGVIDRFRDDQLQMHFDLEKVAPGKYDLRLTNPEHLVLVMPNAIVVRPRIQPRLDAISLHSGYNDRAYRDITVTGGGFLGGTSFFLDRRGHRIEVPNVTIRSSKKATVELDLGSATPGHYDLVAANPGGKVARLRAAVEVLNIRSPVFESMSPRSFTIGESTGAFALRAKDLIPDSQVFLRRGGQLIPTVALGQQSLPSSPGGGGAGAVPSGTPAAAGSGNGRQFQIQLTSTPPGRYDLVIANSQLLRTVVTGAVTIKPKPIPRLTGASITHAYDTLEYKGIILKGANLKPTYGVVLKRGNAARDLVSKFISPNRMSVNIDFRGMSPGTYSVLVQSSGRVVASLPGGISVTTPHQNFIHPTRLRVMIEYPYGLVLSPSFANSVSISTIAGLIVGDFPLGATFFPKIPAIRDMGIGLRVGYSLYDQAATGAAGGTTSTINMARPGMDLYYRTPFNFPLNGYVSVGYGLSLSGFQSSSQSASVSGWSLDFYYRLGAGAELDLGKRIVFEGGVDWLRVLYAVTNLDVLELYLRGGIRLGK